MRECRNVDRLPARTQGIEEQGRKTDKKAAAGLRNRANFRTSIYFHCGGLDLHPEPEKTDRRDPSHLLRPASERRGDKARRADEGGRAVRLSRWIFPATPSVIALVIQWRK